VNTESPPVVALGSHLYEVHRPWGQLPRGVEFTLVSSVAVDDQDRVYVCQRGDPPVIVFDRDGNFLDSWGSGLIADPHGISYSRDGRIWVVDRDAHQVLAFDDAGRLTSTLGKRNAPRLGRPFNHPTDVAVADDGNVYVADGYGNSRVHIFSSDGTHLLSWGEAGGRDGAFTTPHAIWVDGLGRVLVADRENNRVQLFDGGGSFVTAWPDVYHPMDIYEDDAGITYVTDQIPRLSMFDPSGLLVGRSRPVLYGAHGLWGDSFGDIYLAEGRPTNRLTKLVRGVSAED
jgi:peptidylglycine monooxygenase